MRCMNTGGLPQRLVINLYCPWITTDFQLGPYISLMGYARGAMLLVVVPRESNLLRLPVI